MPSGGVGHVVGLTPEQQEQLRQLLEQELRDALRSHEPAAAAEALAERRRALEQLAGGTEHDPQDPLDQGLEGDGVVEQR